MELYGFMEREKKIPSYFFIITKGGFSAIEKRFNLYKGHIFFPLSAYLSKFLTIFANNLNNYLLE